VQALPRNGQRVNLRSEAMRPPQRTLPSRDRRLAVHGRSLTTSPVGDDPQGRQRLAAAAAMRRRSCSFGKRTRAAPRTIGPHVRGVGAYPVLAGHRRTSRRLASASPRTRGNDGRGHRQFGEASSPRRYPGQALGGAGRRPHRSRGRSPGASGNHLENNLYPRRATPRSTASIRPWLFWDAVALDPASRSALARSARPWWRERSSGSATPTAPI
jgi:hypothetical protein